MGREADRTATGAGALAVIESYWRELRGQAYLPARTDVDPARIDAALPSSFILERIAPGIGRMRVAGQRISDLLGMEARGMPLCALFDGPSKDRVQGYLEQVFALPALVELPLACPGLLGRPRLGGRVLLLPLLDTAGRTTRALGVLELAGPQTRAVRGFLLPENGAIRIENVADMPGGTRPPALVRPQPTPALPISLPRPHRSARPYLRLVVSN